VVTDKMLVEIIKKIKAKSRCFIFMSVGREALNVTKKMKKAGSERSSFQILKLQIKNFIIF